MKKQLFPLLGFALMTTPIIAQLPRTDTPTESKVIILKKVIDDNGNETFVEIEHPKGSPSGQIDFSLTYSADTIYFRENPETQQTQMVIQGYEELKGEDIEVLKKAMNRYEKIKNINADIEPASNPKDEEQLHFLFKDKKPFLGVSIEMTEAGVRISDLEQGGAAQLAGLKKDDVLKEIQGEKIETIEQLKQAVAKYQIGETVKVGYLRQNQIHYSNAILQTKNTEEIVMQHQRRRGEHHYYRNTTMADPCKKLEELRSEPFMGVYINIEQGVTGAIISSIINNTGAAASALQEGDILSKINGEPLSDYESLRTILKKYQPGQSVNVTYLRQNKKEKTTVVLSSLADRETRRLRILEELCEDNNKSLSTEPKEEPKAALEIAPTLQLELFPNPAEDWVQLQLWGGQEGETTIVSLLSVDGKELKRYEWRSENTPAFTRQIDLGNLPAGSYFVQVRQGDAGIVKPLLKK